MDRGSNGAGGPGCRDEDNGKKVSTVDWEFLPDDLLARVLSRLPFSSLIRSRSVCKKWNEVNFSSDYTFSGISKGVPIYFFEGPLWVYNSGTDRWEKHSLEFLGLPLKSLALLVSAGGLLCFKNRKTGDLIVCNPITKRWRVVQLPAGFDHEEIRPPMGEIWARTQPEEESHQHQDGKIEITASSSYTHAMAAYQREFGREVIVAMLPQRHDNKTFKLLVAGVFDGSSQRRKTLIFDSLKGKWTVGSEVPEGVRFWESGKALYCNGYLYCVTWSQGLPEGACKLEAPWSIVRYNAMHDSWTECTLRSPGKVLPQLVEHRGRGFVVQQRVNDISFTELKEDPMSMVMSKLWPLHQLTLGQHKFRVSTKGDWCVGQGDCFYLAGEYRHYTELPGLSVLAYDLTMDTWKRLPTLPDDRQPNPIWLRTFEASITAGV